MTQQMVTEAMREKWAPVLEEDVSGPAGLTREDILTRLMENQDNWCRQNPAMLRMEETATSTNGVAGVATWSPVLIKMVKRLVPNLVATDFFGTQPLSTPDGLIFAMRARYASQTGTEAFYNEPNTAFSGTGTHSADPFEGATTGTVPTTGTGMATATAELLGAQGGTAWGKMAVSIEKQSVTAKSRGLYADYTHELRQDMMAVHGEDVDAILSDVLVTEIQAEMNREFIRTMNIAAKWSALPAAVAKQFDLVADTDGRWFLERLKTFMFRIELEANAIAKDTRRGKGNRLLCSANVASALAMAGLLDYNISNLDGQKNLTADVTGQTFAGVLSNGMKVFIDPYAGVDYYNIGYKGPTELDAGIYFAPYTPLEMYRTVGEDNFNPRMAFKTRYGLAANPFYVQDAAGNVATGKGLGDGENGYFRKAKVINLIGG